MKKLTAILISFILILVLAANAFAGQDISSLKASSFASNNTDTSRPKDEGHIYVGYAITDGELDADNSNWETDDIGHIRLDNIMEGEGFTAIRAWGDTDVEVSGGLALQDESDGAFASDFTGTGAAITAAEGANVRVSEMMYASAGFLRSFAVVENSTLILSDSDITALGADPLTDAYDGYYNSAQMSMMLSPPWVLGIQGGVRAVNILGRSDPSTFVAYDSAITSGGWAVVSTDGCTTPQLYFFNTELNILPESRGGMNSGWAILGYEADLYGSGYGTYYIGDASESFYGTSINGATYGSILRGGTGVYEGIKAGRTYTASDISGESKIEYEQTEDIPTVVNTVWGIMNHGGGTIDFNEGSVWNNAEGTVLCKEAGTVWNFNGAEVHPGNGIIFQMMDNDDNTVGGFDPFGTYLNEEAGFPTEGFEGAGGKVELNFANGEYTGDVYNGTGYYAQAADALYVDIADDAALNGDIALTSHIHGIYLDERDADDVIKAIDEANAYHKQIGGYYKGLEDIGYVFLNGDGYITEDKDEAVAIQFTKFSIAEYYLLGHVLNKVFSNGLASLDVTVEGTWKPAHESLVTYLDVKEGAHVYGELIDMEDGSFLLLPSEEEIAPGEYGTAFVYTAAPSPEGDSPEGGSPEAESPEGEALEGGSPEAELPEGETLEEARP